MLEALATGRDNAHPLFGHSFILSKALSARWRWEEPGGKALGSDPTERIRTPSLKHFRADGRSGGVLALGVASGDRVHVGMRILYCDEHSTQLDSGNGYERGGRVPPYGQCGYSLAFISAYSLQTSGHRYAEIDAQEWSHKYSQSHLPGHRFEAGLPASSQLVRGHNRPRNQALEWVQAESSAKPIPDKCDIQPLLPSILPGTAVSSSSFHRDGPQ